MTWSSDFEPKTLFTKEKEEARRLATILAKAYKNEAYHYLVGNIDEREFSRELRRLNRRLRELRSMQVTDPF